MNAYKDTLCSNHIMTNTCPFCEILQNDKQNQIIMRGTYVTAIKKLYDSVNVNFLIIANSHITNLKENLDKTDLIMSETIKMANQLPKGLDWSMTINNGPHAKQTVFHLHTHITSNDRMDKWFDLS